MSKEVNDTPFLFSNLNDTSSFYSFFQTFWRTFVPPWLCETLSSGPPHSCPATALLRLCCSLDLPPRTHAPRVVLITHTSIAAMPMRNVFSITDSPAKPISPPVLLTSLGWPSHHQIKPNIAAMDVLIFLDLPSFSTTSEQTFILPVAQAYNLFPFPHSPHLHSSSTVKRSSFSDEETISWSKAV